MNVDAYLWKVIQDKGLLKRNVKKFNECAKSEIKLRYVDEHKRPRLNSFWFYGHHVLFLYTIHLNPSYFIKP